MLKKRSIIPIIIPFIYLFWSLVLNHLAGPHFLSRSDPEYPYLLNGLNAATLNFNNIGHTDHPGTPFQLVTGISIRLAHIFIGQGSIYEDVIARPQTYLQFASLILTILTFLILWWLGHVALKHKRGWIGMIILQCSVFLSSVLIDFPLRYNPDRFLMLYVLIFAGLVIRYLYSDEYKQQTFAIHSGLLMGIAFATKFNFLPLLILPVFLLPKFKHWLIYGVTTLIAFFVSIIPILNKFKEFRRFISGVATHDGLYGQGAEQVINWDQFFDNLWRSVAYNPALYTFLLIIVILIAIGGIKRLFKSDQKQKVIFIAGIILALIVGLIMVSKHYKNYYLAPILSLTGLIYFFISDSDLIRNRWPKTQKQLLVVGLLVFIGITAWPMAKQYQKRIDQKHLNSITHNFITSTISPNDILFIEPTWLAGPMAENALVYGISYVAHRHQFYPEYHRQYPHVMTWEGESRIPKHFRTLDWDTESILKSGKDIYVYNSPGRNAGLLLNYLDTLSAQTGISIQKDSVFQQLSTQELIIKVSNTDNWSLIMTHNSQLTTPGSRFPDSGFRLSPSNPKTESIVIEDVAAGDYIVATIVVKENDSENPARIILRSYTSDTDGIYFEDSHSLQDLGHKRQLLTLRGHITQAPENGQLELLVYYPGNKKIKIRDLEFSHMGQRE